ncbi:MFS transporter [Cellulomonas fimi]|uniref:Major facilitator superfamily MFS_1 n=1 Tax=Cellulomonas fimi (strain ATCC 484 / DSM 20113 / JCM 1341 / CCUG 24087 / LMG 16345 / NBRC 15513 / NCIMB 8980 / NCTC 7547 / NRS-133) TaxID=590998 RepID=F4H7K6_CELFA|nr:MFS transporter [Cellulomonas fimi]AEE44563.1 major facilitator superfamily MFS_1 [Cellulomonas fimi ATCC 484]NNH06461.1 MFS transporter [Cellulomonas fimi]VEH26632.1 H+ Antiporter protein [Cellulomonas fimi]
MTVVDAPAPPLPRTYLVWLAGLTVGRLGDATLAFALGWAATGLGGTTAALVLASGGLPRVVLLLVGGAVADRSGARRLLVAGEAALLVLAAVLAVALARFGTPTWLLAGAAAALGTVTALCLPASGSMPRRLVPDGLLARALAVRQGSGQVVLLAAAPLGGLLVGAGGLQAVAWGAVAASAVSLCSLLVVRERADPATVDGAVRRAAPSALGVVLRTPGLGAALLLTGASAALALPVATLLVPLLGRTSGWGPGATGAVTGAVGVGSVCAALLAARPARRAGRATTLPLATGLTVSTAGIVLVAAGGSSAPAVAAVGGLVLGFGNGALAARLAPLVLGTAPRTHLARVQALVGLVQAVPVMATTAALGAVAERTTPGAALVLTAAGLAACAVWARRRFTG